MAKPVLLTVDDDPQVLNSVERDLRSHFGGEYRIIKAGSGQEALETVKRLAQRNDALALFLVDQRMPNMSGTEFLSKASEIFPDARKVLLTAYADTEAAIASINEVGLDYYLLKPWDPPEINLYPILEDLLGKWQAGADLPYEGIRIAGTLWSPASHDIKDFLTRNQVPYQWLDIERDARTRNLVEHITDLGDQLPVVFFPDGEVMLRPDRRALADKIGMQTEASQPFYDLIIIGAGPAGLAAAVNAGSEGLHTLMIEKEAVGGQAGTSSRIENYLGFPNGLSGGELARRAATQAKRFGVEILTTQEVVSISAEDPYRYVTLADGHRISCHALLVATGVTTRRLDAPGVERLTGAGVYYGAALAEAIAYRDQDVYVVGGANSAGQAAVFFARYARSVAMLVRGTSLRQGMSRYLRDQIGAIDNIQVLTRTEVIEAHGSDRLERITYGNRDTGETNTVDAGALFLLIGAVPHSAMLEGVVERNSSGFVLTGIDLMPEGRRPACWRRASRVFSLRGMCGRARCGASCPPWARGECASAMCTSISVRYRGAALERRQIF